MMLSLFSLTLSLTAMAAAQFNPAPMNATNTTVDLSSQKDVLLTLDFQTPEGKKYWPKYLLNINTTTTTLNNSVQGVSQLVNASSYSSVNANGASNIAFISCDALPGFATADYVLAQAILRNPLAVVLYSNYSDFCNVTGSASYSNIYSMKSTNDSAELQLIINSFAGYQMTPVWAYIEPMGVSNVTRDMQNGTSSNNNNPNGTPTTAIAMIILYTITGVITVLFLVVIITGAIRAHRHPERYGLRTAAGRPRRSRAHGLARAMLDSLPIVKFGERDDANPKPTELELGHSTPATHGPVELLSPPPQTDAHPPTTTTNDPISKSATTPHLAPSPATPLEEHDLPSGIAPATTHTPSSSSPIEDHSSSSQGCSICTEDFERGQDQRVLPCNHKFHPACIDPWLLNVSATCPLCRIDLQPRRSSSDSSQSVTNGQDLAPPLDLQDGDNSRTGGGESRRLSRRRSFVAGILGLGSGRAAGDLSREERVAGLRELRARRLLVRERDRVDVGGATVEEEGRIRGRLRGLIRGRRRRTGDGGIEEEGVVAVGQEERTTTTTTTTATTS